jgi:predicted aldo/keto reductase-like oxidoreductase
MKYRKFGRLDWETSVLGFGCMRFPTSDGNPFGGKIVEDEATRMVRHAIDSGVNYIDTAYPYHEGRSEVLLSKALGNGYRERVKLATKSPVWLVKERDDFGKYLDEQLERLQTDHVDFYLLHGLTSKSWRETVLAHDLIGAAEEALGDGRIRHLGFSFHDDNEAFREIVDGYDRWTFCQIQYNYMDTENQAGTDGLRYAASKGLAVVVMEPLLGGRLSNPPAPVKEVLARSGEGRTPSELALQWIWDQPEVTLLLSGMTTMAQVDENLGSARRSGVGSLSKADFDLVEEVRRTYESLVPIRCTKCGYCMPCPNGVDIPENFDLFNGGFIHEDVGRSRNSYSKFMKEEARASACIQCGECEEKCPQKLSISELMPEVHAVLGEGRPYKKSW